MSEKIEQFFLADGSLVKIPVRSKKKIAVLHHIASTLTPDVKYPEKALNEILRAFHADTAALRRNMIECGILQRDNSSVYWLNINA